MVSLDISSKSGRGFLKASKLINEVILSEKYSKLWQLNPFFVTLCFLLISLRRNISKYFFGLQAMVKMQGSSMHSISKFLRHFLKFSFLVLKFSQYSCELSNLMKSQICYTTKPMFIFINKLSFHTGNIVKLQ